MQPTQTAVLKIALSETERTEVMRLLADQKLPVTDIREETLLYLLQDEDQAVGTAGLDIFEDCAL
ncbi:MAG TPA: hypothetical protein PKD93_10795, partial [Ferruginibacter sp.]|nr:hypothetical protein [Ferruginibacter sp.]